MGCFVCADLCMTYLWVPGLQMSPKRKAKSIVSPSDSQKGSGRKLKRRNQAITTPTLSSNPSSMSIPETPDSLVHLPVIPLPTTSPSIKKALSAVLQTDSLNIPFPIIGLVADYAAPHDFKESEFGQGIQLLLLNVYTDKSTGSAILSFLNQTGYAEYDVDRKRSVKSGFGYSYSWMGNVIRRVKISDDSITNFALLRPNISSKKSFETTSVFLPSVDPDVLYTLRVRTSCEESMMLFFDRLEATAAKSRCISQCDPNNSLIGSHWEMTWNTDRRLTTESSIWVSALNGALKGFVLHGHSFDVSNGKCRTAFKTPDAIRCVSQKILSLSSGIVLFFATGGVYAINPMTCEIEHIHEIHGGGTLVSSISCVHEPSRTLFFNNFNSKINSIYLPPHLFPLQECPCGFCDVKFQK
jgi:hypothetical protein